MKHWQRIDFKDEEGRVWKIDEFVTSGGYGYVFKATCENSSRRRIVKIEPAYLGAIFKEFSVYSLLSPRESRVVKFAKTYGCGVIRFKYPNCAVCEPDQVGEFGYLLMKEYVTDMHRLCCTKSPNVDVVTPRNITRWAKQIAIQIHHLHSCGYMHYDIKPSNIVYERETNTAYLIDYGLVVRLDTSLDINDGKAISTEFIKGRLLSQNLIAFRDDWESLGYCLMSICGLALPWYNYEKSKKNYALDVFKSKIALFQNLATALKPRCPTVAPICVNGIRAYLRYIDSLGCDQRPKLFTLMKLFDAMSEL